MKKIILMMLFASTFACSSSDNDSQQTIPNAPSETQHLSGRWNLSKKSVNGQIQTASSCEVLYNYYQFSADGGAIIGVYHMYSMNGGSYFCQQSATEGTYVIENGVLTYTMSSGYVSKYNLIGANELTLTLEKFYYTTNTGAFTISEPNRVIEICNKAQ